MKSEHRGYRYNYPVDTNLEGNELLVIRGVLENAKVPMIRSYKLSITDKDYRKRMVHRLINTGYLKANLTVTEKGLIAIGAKPDPTHDVKHDSTNDSTNDAMQFLKEDSY